MIFQINIVIAIVITDSLYLVWDSTMRAFHHTPEFQSIIMKLSKIPLDSITPHLEFQRTPKLWVPLTRNSTGLQNSTPGIPLDSGIPSSTYQNSTGLQNSTPLIPVDSAISGFRLPGIPPGSRTPYLAFRWTLEFRVPLTGIPPDSTRNPHRTWNSSGIPPEFQVHFY